MLGIAPEGLRSFLEVKFAKSKKAKNELGVLDPKLAANISETVGIKCVFTGVVPEVVRGLYFGQSILYASKLETLYYAEILLKMLNRYTVPLSRSR